MNLSNEIIKSIKPKKKEQILHDTGKASVNGLKLRVSPRGIKMFYFFYNINGKRRKYKIGEYSKTYNLQQARKEADKLRGKVNNDIDPQEERQSKRVQVKSEKNKQYVEKLLILRNYLDEKYYIDIENKANDCEHRSTKRTKQILEYNFEEYMDKSINKLTTWEIKKWRKNKIIEGLKPSTVNRAVTSLKACLNWAFQEGLITEKPLKGLKKLDVTESGVVRHLSNKEEARLYKALEKRTGYFPVLVKLLLHTGLRPREALTLEWKTRNGEGTLDLNQKVATVLSYFAKSKKTRHVPLNYTVLAVMKEWKKESKSYKSKFVFPSHDKEKHITTVQRIWKLVLKEAKISNFRLYDLRHTFASKLVMDGATLYEVSKLLGHSDINMSEIYAHLSPEHLSSVVSRIG